MDALQTFRSELKRLYPNGGRRSSTGAQVDIRPDRGRSGDGTGRLNFLSGPTAHFRPSGAPDQAHQGSLRD